jgi:hypothetical protein
MLRQHLSQYISSQQKRSTISRSFLSHEELVQHAHTHEKINADESKRKNKQGRCIFSLWSEMSKDVRPSVQLGNRPQRTSMWACGGCGACTVAKTWHCSGHPIPIQHPALYPKLKPPCVGANQGDQVAVNLVVPLGNEQLAKLVLHRNLVRFAIPWYPLGHVAKLDGYMTYPSMLVKSSCVMSTCLHESQHAYPDTHVPFNLRGNSGTHTHVLSKLRGNSGRSNGNSNGWCKLKM